MKPAIFSASVLVALAFAGCGRHDNAAKESARELPIAEVRVQTVESKPHMATEEVTGTIHAKKQATIEAKVSGRIEAMPITLGEKVQNGQLLARLDAREIAARLDQTEAVLEQTERDWARISALFKQESVTRAEYDSAQARLRAARAAVAEAKATAGYTEIVAPFQGVVTRKLADVGDMASPGKPLVELEDASTLEFEAAVPELIAGRIKVQSRLAVHVDAASADLQAVVKEIAPAADPVTRTFRVKAELPSAPGLASGQFGRLAIPTGERSSIRVPSSAVVQRGQLDIVFSVTNSVARMRLVKTGKRVGQETEILAGLGSGETVVIAGAEQLADGQRVEVK